jgi:quinol monooxygenase YgiN
MIMITVHARLLADHRDAALAAANQMSASSVAEPGCLDYRFWTSTSDPNSMLLLEQWQDQAALDLHLQSPHLGGFIEAIGPTLDGAMEATRHEVASSGPLF